jgi:hypothetical protein
MKTLMTVRIAFHLMLYMDCTGSCLVKTRVPVSASDTLPSRLNCDWLAVEEFMMEEWVETTALRPSNKLLIAKMFSSQLDRTPMDPELWDAISCPVLVIHGGKF